MKKYWLLLAWWFVMSMGGDNAALLMVGPFQLKDGSARLGGCKEAEASVEAPARVLVPCFFAGELPKPPEKRPWAQ